MVLQTLESQAPTSWVDAPAGAVVGDTPLLPLRRLLSDKPRVSLWAKAEWFNASGSVKDRPAREILQQALSEGRLQGRRLLDATSGNMGIAYATFAAAWGVPVTLAMPANASPERIAVLRGLGAELVLTDPETGVDGAMAWVARQAELHPDRYYWANQYDNPANWRAHYHTTGPEIARQTGGRVTHVVAGTGTGGTLTGIGRYLRSVLPDVRLIGVQPAGGDEPIPGLKHMATSSRRPAIYDAGLPDAVRYVRAAQAHAMARRLAREEGLFVGPSAAAAVWAACEVAAELQEGMVVVILPDAGYKYLSSPLWGEEPAPTPAP